MDQGLKILATICARGGSKGLPGKNIRDIDGIPLIAYTIQQALEAFGHVIVSTDSREIASISERYGASVPFLRPANLATDQSTKFPVIRHALFEYEKLTGNNYDIVVDLDPTSPLRTIKDIDNCVKLLIEKEASNVITAMKSRRSPYFNLIERYEDGKIDLSKPISSPITHRQGSPECYDMNASIYVWERDSILNTDTVFLDRTELYIMPEERSIDIDSEIDFRFVEYLIKSNNEK